MLKLPVKPPIVNGDIDLSEYAKKSDVDAIDASLDNKAEKKDVEELSSQLDTKSNLHDSFFRYAMVQPSINIGDSISEGSNALDYVNESWCGLLNKAYQK